MNINYNFQIHLYCYCPHPSHHYLHPDYSNGLLFSHCPSLPLKYHQFPPMAGSISTVRSQIKCLIRLNFLRENFANYNAHHLLSISFNLFPNCFYSTFIIFFIWLPCWSTMAASFAAVSPPSTGSGI